MSDYSDIPDLFARYPADHPDDRLAGKLRVGAFTKDLFHLVTEWTLLELLDAPHVVITMDEGEVSVKISSPMPQEESERIKNLIGLRGQLKLMPTEASCTVRY